MKVIREKIFEAVGEASMCWNPIPKGVFDSTKAGDVGDRLEAEIKKIVLDMVENSTVEFEISSVKYGIDSLISKAEIRKKIEGEL